MKATWRQVERDLLRKLSLRSWIDGVFLPICAMCPYWQVEQGPYGIADHAITYQQVDRQLVREGMA